MSKKAINTVGKRKEAVAHATLREGTGVIRINSLHIDHFSPAVARARILEPVMLAGDISKLNIDITMRGGGQMSQADAARLAVGRALLENNKKLAEVFLDYDRQLLVADVRFKEAAKPNKHGSARSATQKSYR